MTSKIGSNRQKSPPQRHLKGLTSKQRMFVAELQADPSLSATQAASRAGYKNAAVMGNKLLNNTVIKGAVSAALTKRITTADIKAEEIDRTLFEAVQFDPADIFEDSPTGTLTLKELQKMVERSRRCITGVKVRQRFTKDGVETEVDVKWMDKLAAAKLLYQRLQLLEPESKSGGAQVNINFLSELRDSLSGRTVSPIVDGEVLDGYIKEDN